MLINYSNHPMEKWMPDQIEAARKVYGTICDIAFPYVSPEAGSEELVEIARKDAYRIGETIRQANPTEIHAVMCQGEYIVSMVVTALLQKQGITVVTAASERRVTERITDGEIRKESVFEFVRFRQIPELCRL